MAEKQCNLIKNGGGIETDNTGSQIATGNTSDITITASTWTKVCSLDVTNRAKGRYLAIGTIGHPVSTENNVYYVRIAYNNNANNTLLNTPYGNDCIIGAINITDSTTSIDLWLYGKAHTLSTYYSALRLVRLFE